MAVTIRRATRLDREAWGALRAQLWPDADPAELLAELGSWLKRPRFGAWLAIESGNLVGFAEAYLRDFANGCESQPVAFLEGIWIQPRLRGRGIGRSLLAAVEAWALAKGSTELGSDAYLSKRASQRIHKAWGFSETERVVYFRKPLRKPAKNASKRAGCGTSKQSQGRP